MNKGLHAAALGFACGMVLLLGACARTEPAPAARGAGVIKRTASVTQLRPEMVEEYKRLHANTWPEVLEAMQAGGSLNCSIYLKEIDGKHFLFAYFEEDASRKRAIKRSPEEQARVEAVLNRWGEATRACQMPLPGETGIWLPMEEVFHMP